MQNVIDVGRKINLPEYHFIKSIFLVAFKPWIILITSWIFVGVSITISWQVPASGAVLVCGALLAEMFYQHQRWTKMNTDPNGSFKLVSDASTNAPIINGMYVNTPAGTNKLGYLLSLAKDFELNKNETESEIWWHYNDTVQRVEKLVFTAIATTGVLGTVLWGYGHLFFNVSTCT